MNAKGYLEHILPTLNQFWQSESARTHDYVYIQQDNASSNRSRSTIIDLQERGLYNYLLPWPPTSPDMHLIEVLWRLMRSRIGKLVPGPHNNNDMMEASKAQWDAITEHDLGEILDTMINGVDTLVSSNGGPTKS